MSVVEALAATVVLAAVMLLYLVPAATGWAPLTVLTSSMSPGMPPGSLVVVEPVSQKRAARLAIGDVATYLPSAGSDALITHRIVGMSAGIDGAVTYVFQGDANPQADPDPVRPEQIRGLRRYHVPAAGRVLTLLQPGEKQVGRTVLVGGLVVYALYQVRAAVSERRGPRADRRRRHAQTELPSVSGNTDG